MLREEDSEDRAARGRWRVLLVWWIVTGIWSTIWLAIKIGVTDIPPFTFAALRLAIAIVLLLPIVFLRRVPMPAWRDVGLIASTGAVLLGLNYAFTYWGAQHISSGLTAVIQATTPAFGVLLAARYLPEERLSAGRLAALALGVAGVAVIFSNELHMSGWMGLLGSASVVGGAVCVAVGYVAVKVRGTQIDRTVLMVGQMMAGLLVLLPLVLTWEHSPLIIEWTSRAVAALLYLVLGGSLVAFWLNYWLLQRMGATPVLLMAVVEPLFAVLLGAAVLGEPVTARTAIGGAWILVSTGLLLLRPTPLRRTPARNVRHQ